MSVAKPALERVGVVKDGRHFEVGRSRRFHELRATPAPSKAIAVAGVRKGLVAVLVYESRDRNREPENQSHEPVEFRCFFVLGRIPRLLPCCVCWGMPLEKQADSCETGLLTEEFNNEMRYVR